MIPIKFIFTNLKILFSFILRKFWVYKILGFYIKLNIT